MIVLQYVATFYYLTSVRERFKRIQFLELFNLTLYLFQLLDCFLPLSQSFRINLNLVFSNQKLLISNQFSSWLGIQLILTRTTIYCNWTGSGWKKHVRAYHHTTLLLLFFIFPLNLLPHLYIAPPKKASRYRWKLMLGGFKMK